MISMLTRLGPRYNGIRSSIRSFKNLKLQEKRKPNTSQIDYLLSVFEKKNNDWNEIKENVLKLQGDTNSKNFDGMILKMMKSSKKFDLAQSFVAHLKNSNEELNLGSINGILSLYSELSLQRPLNQEEKTFILDIHDKLYKKYQILDFVTSEKLILALCAIDEWEKSMKILENVYLSSVPTHAAYSTIIATLFKNNKKTDALKLIEVSLNNNRPLNDIAYEEWANYYLRKHTKKDTIIKNLEIIFEHLTANSVVISEVTAEKIKETITNLDWKFNYVKIRKDNGECVYCKTKLESLDLDRKEFAELQKTIKEKIIVGSDLFLKTSPEELKRFQNFLSETAPYDVVLDALNISYTAIPKTNVSNRKQRQDILIEVVDYFHERNKKILLLGRRHILGETKKRLHYIMNKTCSFFTEDVSQDDPFFITAAIMSGPNTDIVSKDLLRGHRFLLKDLNLRRLFQRWQWQHQWMVYNTRKGLIFQAPLKFTPCAQKNGKGWHIPYKREDESNFGHVHDNIPDHSSWICLKPNKIS